MIKNFRDIKGIQGISLLLILMWTLGDTANLVGGILTKQLPLQIYLAVYFVFADLVLFAQFLYYNCYWKKKYKDYEPIPSTSTKSVGVGTSNGNVSQIVLCISGAMTLCLHKSFQIYNSSHESSLIHQPAGRSLLSTDLKYHIHIFHNLEDEVGYGIGVVSSVFYTVSRVGQMFKNYKRQSTDGLSIMMFILAVLGNLTYGLSILVRQLDVNYILKHLPWLIGSLGVIFLDLSLLVQFKYYEKTDDMNSLLKQPILNDTVLPDEVEVYVPAHRDHSASVNSITTASVNSYTIN
ncbi:lysosomal amino acid transporter 1 homolog isoform X2 [Mya arenaria]|nr:lysosomal amino acid transporter 1 homolog isoform X2 [Mya arenaria]